MLWPLLPLLYLWPIPPLGRRLYHLAAGSRAAWTWPLRPRAESPPDAQRSALVAVTVSLLAINVGFGLAAVSHAWPFACYPRFDSVIRAPRMLSIGVEVRDASGALIEMDQRLLNQRFTRSKYRGLVRRILYAPDAENTNARLEAFWSVLGEVDPKLGRAARVRFHRDRLSTVPGERESNPISRELLYELILERRAAS